MPTNFVNNRGVQTVAPSTPASSQETDLHARAVAAARALAAGTTKATAVAPVHVNAIIGNVRQKGMEVVAPVGTPGSDTAAPACTTGFILNPFAGKPRDDWDAYNRCVAELSLLGRALMYTTPPYLPMSSDVPSQGVISNAVTAWATDHGITAEKYGTKWDDIAIGVLVYGHPLPATPAAAVAVAQAAATQTFALPWYSQTWFYLVLGGVGLATVIGGVLLMKKKKPAVLAGYRRR